jgi:riboflavin kinase / FMN adenylyltransferase
MPIIGIDAYTSNSPSVVTIGNFDGCHLGHQKLLQKTVEQATIKNASSVALTFSPRPEAWFRKISNEPLIFSPQQKTRKLSEYSIESHIVQNFDEDFSEISHESFFNDILVRKLKTKALIIGENFLFGHKRQGNIRFLKSACRESAIDLFVIPSAKYDGQPISSTRIRQAIRDGQMELVSSLLGHRHTLSGSIIRGDQIGRTIGFPTANLSDVNQLLPKHGVYRGTIQVGGLDSLDAVINIGVRPTLGGNDELRIEAHVLNRSFENDEFYDLNANFSLLKYIRPEKKFASLDELKKQIQLDIKACNQSL